MIAIAVIGGEAVHYEVNLNVEIDQGPFYSEAQFQAACFLYSWNKYVGLRRLFFKVHNEGKKGKKRSTQDKSMGIVAGEPDIVWMWPGFGAECKMPGEEQSDNQKKVEAIWTLFGIPYYLVETPDEYVDLCIKKIGC